MARRISRGTYRRTIGRKRRKATTRKKHRRYKTTKKRKSRKRRKDRGGGKGSSKKKDEPLTREEKAQDTLGRMGNLPVNLQTRVLGLSHGVGQGGLPAMMHTQGPHRGALRNRMAAMSKFSQGVKNRLKLQVAIPGFNVGQLMKPDNINDALTTRNLTPAQDKEVRRLVARLYTGGYDDEYIFGTGELNSKTGEQVSVQQRQALLAQGGINDTTINNDGLPLPLQILRKNRRTITSIIARGGQAWALSNKYPRKVDGSIDETHDIFWPKNKKDFYYYMKTFPTLEEIRHYGW